MCVGVCGYNDYYSLEEFETARQQTAHTLRLVNLFTLRKQLYQGICIFWWLELIQFISRMKGNICCSLFFITGNFSFPFVFGYVNVSC